MHISFFLSVEILTTLVGDWFSAFKNEIDRPTVHCLVMWLLIPLCGNHKRIHRRKPRDPRPPLGEGGAGSRPWLETNKTHTLSERQNKTLHVFTLSMKLRFIIFMCKYLHKVYSIKVHQLFDERYSLFIFPYSYICVLTEFPH